MYKVLSEQLKTPYSYCCVACSGCCNDPIKVSNQLGQVLVSSDGFIEPLSLFKELTGTQRVILIRLAINYPRPIQYGHLVLYDDISIDSLKTQVHRMRPVIHEYDLNIVSYRGFGYAVELVHAI